jgi:hypothetical protein
MIIGSKVPESSKETSSTDKPKYLCVATALAPSKTCPRGVSKCQFAHDRIMTDAELKACMGWQKR